MDNVEDWCTYLRYSDALAVTGVSKPTPVVERIEVPTPSSKLVFVFERCQFTRNHLQKSSKIMIFTKGLA